MILMNLARENGSTKKTCRPCQRILSVEAFGWRSVAERRLQPECLECSRRRGREYASKHAAQARLRKARWSANNAERTKATNRLYYETHLFREKARKKAFRAANVEHCKAVARRSYEKNKANHRKCMAAWNERNAEYLKAYRRAYYEANKAAYFKQSFDRTAKKKATKVARFSRGSLDARMSVFGHRCAYCGGPFQHIDHVIPLSKGGAHILANLRPACASCNLRKSARMPAEWFRLIGRQA